MDFSPPQSSARPPDFGEVSRALTRRAFDLCQYLLPAGVKRGHEFVVGSLHGEKGQSLSVNLNTGVWSDFATGETGADLIDLWAAVTQSDLRQACIEAAQWAGIDVPAGKGNGADPDPDSWWKGRSPDRAWLYTDAAGNPWGEVRRWDHPAGQGKRIRPWNGYAERRPEGLAPLLDLPALSAQETHPSDVIVVEGEACVDALKAQGFLATTWMGGSSAVDRTDWAPLQGRSVILWPDNDDPGRAAMEKIAGILTAATVRFVEPPRDVAKGWDAADAEPSWVRSLVTAARAKPPRRPKQFGLPQINHWMIGDSMSQAPESQGWLVSRIFPMGKVSLFASPGGAGKGMLMLDLALKVAGYEPPREGFDYGLPVAFDSYVEASGRAVIYAAEDDLSELHRRVEALAPTDRGSWRQTAGNRLSLIPLPDAGGIFSIVEQKGNVVRMTDAWTRICEDILAWDDVKLIVFDPLASFVQADINADPAAGAYLMGQIASLAAMSGAAVIVTHHTSKVSISGPDSARDAIRGTGALVNGVRSAYVIWPAPSAKEVSTKKAYELDMEARNMVFEGAIVKANGPADMRVRTYVRHPETGLLEPVSIDKMERVPIHSELPDAMKGRMWSMLRESVRRGSAAGAPFQKTGREGVYERRADLHPELRGLSRDLLRALIDDLARKGDVLRVDTHKAGAWIDVPGGALATGGLSYEFNDGERADLWPEYPRNP